MQDLKAPCESMARLMACTSRREKATRQSPRRTVFRLLNAAACGTSGSSRSYVRTSNVSPAPTCWLSWGILWVVVEDTVSGYYTIGGLPEPPSSYSCKDLCRDHRVGRAARDPRKASRHHMSDGEGSWQQPRGATSSSAASLQQWSERTRAMSPVCFTRKPNSNTEDPGSGQAAVEAFTGISVEPAQQRQLGSITAEMERARGQAYT